MMTILEAYHPYLIGSTWTGHIRTGSDIDINLYGDSPQSVAEDLEKASIPFQFERVFSRKQGHEREFLHFHIQHSSGLAVEVTLYPLDEKKIHPTCSISGGPMARGTLAQVRHLLQDHEGKPFEPLPPSEQVAQLYPLQLEALLPHLSELVQCRGVTQNHYHHLDVYQHTLAVVTELERFVREDFQAFAPWDDSLRQHFASDLAPGWTRTSVLMLAGLCHDLGKPATWALQRDGRISFHGHERLSETLTRNIAERWKIPATVAAQLSCLVAHHMQPLHFVSNPGAPSLLHEMFRTVDDLIPELMLLSVADISAACGPAQPLDRVEQQKTFALEMLEEYFEHGFLRHPNTPVTATDLEWELGIREGSSRRELLKQLTSLYVDGEFQGREDGLAVAAELWETLPKRSPSDTR